MITVKKEITITFDGEDIRKLQRICWLTQKYLTEHYGEEGSDTSHAQGSIFQFINEVASKTEK